MVTEERWEADEWVCITLHAALHGLFTGRGAHSGRSRARLERCSYRCLTTCRGLDCFSLSLSLTASPTASSYITPSPSPGPPPAFIGLFLSISPLAFYPTDHGLCLAAQRRFARCEPVSVPCAETGLRPWMAG